MNMEKNKMKKKIIKKELRLSFPLLTPTPMTVLPVVIGEETAVGMNSCHFSFHLLWEIIPSPLKHE